MTHKVINLLPKSRLKDLYQETIFYRLLSVVWLTVFSFTIVIGVQIYAQFQLQRELDSYQGQVDQLRQQVNKKENSELKDRIKNLNNIIGDYKNLSAGIPKLSKVLVAFAALPPEGVSINSMAIDPIKKTAVVSGFSPTRDGVIDFYNALVSDSQNFNNVDYPLQHIVKATDVPFQFTFSIQDQLLK